MTEAEAVEVQLAAGKSFLLEFLPWLGADARIGYTPERVRRGSGWGRWQEFYRTEAEARGRLEALIALEAIEDAAVRREVPGQGMCTTLLHEWRAVEP